LSPNSIQFIPFALVLLALSGCKQPSPELQIWGFESLEDFEGYYNGAYFQSIMIYHCNMTATETSATGETETLEFWVHDENTGDDYTYCRSVPSDALWCFSRTPSPGKAVFADSTVDESARAVFTIYDDGRATANFPLISYEEKSFDVKTITPQHYYGSCEKGQAYPWTL
jgi:hypothetical protein